MESVTAAAPPPTDRAQRPAVDLLAQLVAIPSVNPRSAPGTGDGGETRIAHFVTAWGRHRGWPARVDEVLPGRSNGTVLIPGQLPGTVLLQTHSDTVETEGMTVPAFVLTPVAGSPRRVSGRGVCDAKGQLAMFMAGIEAAVGSGRPHHSVILAVCADEEERFRGVLELLDRLDPAEVAGAVIGEPTGLRLVTEHKGVLRGRIVVRGPGGHSSHATRLPNPIETAAEVINHLGRSRGADQLPVTVTMISGGEAINIIPRTVVLDYDRRTMPAEDPLAVWRALREDLRSRWPQVEVEEPALADPGLRAGGSTAFSDSLLQCLAGSGLDAAAHTVSYGSDASKIARLGIPAVVFGAGSIDQAHQADEHLDLGQLETGAHVIAELLSSEGFGAPS
jgi:acetylornithine deacetylase